MFIRLLLPSEWILILHPIRSRGSGPGLKRVGGGTNLAMSSLSLPPGDGDDNDGDGDDNHDDTLPYID